MSPGAIFALRVMFVLLGGVASWWLAVRRGHADPASSAMGLMIPVLMYAMLMSAWEAKEARDHNIE